MTADRERGEALVERVVEELRRPVEVDPWLDQRIMRAIREARPESRWERGLAWLRKPIPLRVSPLSLAAGLAALAALLVFRPAQAPVQAPAEPAVVAIPASTSVGQNTVQFVLVLPTAREVAVVGDFNDWNPAATPLRRAGDGGTWTVEVRLPAGHHRYAFVVDGQAWMPDPGAPRSADDDYGKPNSVVLVEGAA